MAISNIEIYSLISDGKWRWETRDENGNVSFTSALFDTIEEATDNLSSQIDDLEYEGAIYVDNDPRE